MKSLIGLCLLASVGCIEDVDEGYPTGTNKRWLEHHVVQTNRRIMDVEDTKVVDMERRLECDIVWRFLGTRDDPDAGRVMISGAIARRCSAASASLRSMGMSARALSTRFSRDTLAMAL